MGLFSKIKKGISGTWKGIKGVVKRVARTVKKVAKRVAYAVPGGKALWKAGTKLGKGIMKGIGKLGPVGILAIQVVLSATGLGAGIASALGSMWSSMGAAAAAAANAGGLMGALATGANWAITGINSVVNGLGAVGDALAAGGKNLAKGQFSDVATSFGKTLTESLAGGTADTLASQAASKLASDAGIGMWEQAMSAGSDALATSGGTLAGLGKTTFEQATGAVDVTGAVPLQSAGPAAFDPSTLVKDVITPGPQSASTVGGFDVMKAADAAKPWYQKVGASVMETGEEFLKDKGKDYIKKAATSLLSPKSNDMGPPTIGYQPMQYGDYVPVLGGTFAGPSYAKVLQATRVGGG